MAKECRLCKGEIPSYITVEGKKRNLANRTLCLKCLPFKSGRYVKKFNCGFCGEETRNPKFCSRSCRAKSGSNRKGTGKYAGSQPPTCRAEGCVNPVRYTDPNGHARQPNSFCDACIADGTAFAKKTLSEMVTGKSLRDRLLKTRDLQCAECGLEEWQGHPVPLEVDHIDGDASNNTEDNLRLICVTCHVQTPTWGARNRGKSARKKRMERYHAGKTY